MREGEKEGKSFIKKIVKNGFDKKIKKPFKRSGNIFVNVLKLTKKLKAVL